MTTTRQHEVIEGVQKQRHNEDLYWSVDISGFGSNPINIIVTVYDKDYADVTSSVTTGSPIAFSPTIIKLPLLHSLEKGNEYLVDIEFETPEQPAQSCYIVISVPSIPPEV